MLGDPTFEMNSKLFSAFIQDDWRAGENVKVIYGFRYDGYFYPEADPNAPFSYSQQLQGRPQQLRSAARRRLDARRQEGPGRAGQHGDHV